VVDLGAAVRDRLVELDVQQVVARGGLADEVGHQARVVLGGARPDDLPGQVDVARRFAAGRSDYHAPADEIGRHVAARVRGGAVDVVPDRHAVLVVHDGVRGPAAGGHEVGQRPPDLAVREVADRQHGENDAGRQLAGGEAA